MIKLKQLYNEIKLIKQNNPFKYDIGDITKANNNITQGNLLILKRGTYEMFNPSEFDIWSQSVMERFKDGNWYLVQLMRYNDNKSKGHVWPEAFMDEIINEIKMVPPNRILLKRDGNYYYFLDSNGYIWEVNKNELRNNISISFVSTSDMIESLKSFFDKKNIKYKIIKYQFPKILIDKKYFVISDNINEIKLIPNSGLIDKMCSMYNQMYDDWIYYDVNDEVSYIGDMISDLLYNMLFRACLEMGVWDKEQFRYNLISFYFFQMKGTRLNHAKYMKELYDEYHYILEQSKGLNEIKMLSPYYMKVFNLALQIKSNIVKISEKKKWESEMKKFAEFFDIKYNVYAPTTTYTNTRFGQELKLLSNEELKQLYKDLNLNFKEYI